jgi:hypothetical protein
MSASSEDEDDHFEDAAPASPESDPTRWAKAFCYITTQQLSTLDGSSSYWQPR